MPAAWENAIRPHPIEKTKEPAGAEQLGWHKKAETQHEWRDTELDLAHGVPGRVGESTSATKTLWHRNPRPRPHFRSLDGRSFSSTMTRQTWR